VTNQQRPVKKEQGFQAVWPNHGDKMLKRCATRRARRYVTVMALFGQDAATIDVR
jgi:hypothetical protein